jgi:thermosome
LEGNEIAGIDRYSGEDAQRMNILATRVVAETIKTTLGPKGMDKMLVDSSKDVAITDSGSTILSLINLKHPAARMLVNVAETQDKEVGDGSTTAVVLTGELLKNAEELLNQGLHPITIVKGYRMAEEKALKFLEESSFAVSDGDLINLARTILMGKVGKEEVEHLARIAVEAVNIAIDADNIKIEYRPGGRICDTKLIKGIMIDLGKRVHPAMPKKVRGGRILLIDKEFDVRNPKNAKIEMYAPSDMRAFSQYKEKVLRVAVDIIARSGANVVLCQKNIADVAMFYMAQAGILGVRDVERDVLELLEKATGAKIVSNINEVNPSVLGYAGLVEESKIGIEEIMYITECREPKAAGILIRGGSENIAMEVKRRMEDLVAVLSHVKKDMKAIAGGGAVELEISRKLRKYAKEIEGKEQLAVEAYASALEVIPKALAYNSGQNPIDILTRLRAEHERGRSTAYYDVEEGKIRDARETGLIEYIGTKRQAIKSSTEVANTILRIDEVLLAKGFGKEKPPAEAPPEPEGPPVMDFPAKGGKIDLAAMRKG